MYDGGLVTGVYSATNGTGFAGTVTGYWPWGMAVTVMTVGFKFGVTLMPVYCGSGGLGLPSRVTPPSEIFSGVPASRPVPLSMTL